MTSNQFKTLINGKGKGKRTKKPLETQQLVRLSKAGININNPFTKYLSSEDVIHIEIYKWLIDKYPAFLITHYPNEGKRTPFERWKAKILGIKSGMPDIMIYQPFKTNENLRKSGIALEVKDEKGTLSKNQKECLKRLQYHDWLCFVVKSLEEAQIIAKTYYEALNIR